MSITDQNQLPEGRMDQLLVGLEQEVQSVAEEICNIKRPRMLSGKVPIWSGGAKVQGSQDADKRQLSPGAKGKELDSETGETSFHAGRYGTWMPIPRDHVIQLGELNEDALSEGLETLVRQANNDLDKDLSDLLTDTSLNETVSASNQWSDTSTPSDPLGHIESAYNKVPGADLLVLGKQDVTNLKKHPDIQPADDNYDRSANAANGVRSFLLEYFEDEGLEEVHFFTKKERINNEGQPLNMSRIHSKGPWLGYSRDIVMVDPQVQGNPERSQRYIGERDSFIVSYHRRADLIRPHTVTGCYIQNT